VGGFGGGFNKREYIEDGRKERGVVGGGEGRGMGTKVFCWVWMGLLMEMVVVGVLDV